MLPKRDLSWLKTEGYNFVLLIDFDGCYKEFWATPEKRVDDTFWTVDEVIENPDLINPAKFSGLWNAGMIRRTNDKRWD